MTDITLSEPCKLKRCRVWCGKITCAGAEDRAVQAYVTESVTSMANTSQTMANKPEGMANTPTYQYRDAGKRREYMRNLMRERRANIQ